MMGSAAARSGTQQLRCTQAVTEDGKTRFAFSPPKGGAVVSYIELADSTAFKPGELYDLPLQVGFVGGQKPVDEGAAAAAEEPKASAES